MKDKKILAIETSAELCSVSLAFEFKKFDERNVMMKHIHSERLIPLIEEILKSNKILPDELYCIAISMGPGSFTGLRIGMTAAKGIAFASNLPIVPVPTFDALTLEISDHLPDDTEFCIINNANVDECYFGKYGYKDHSIVTLNEVKLIKKSDIEKKINKVAVLFGNITNLNGVHKVSSPRASSISKWTYLFGEDLLTFDYDYLEPNYLKNFKVRNIK